jgi:hypothetical protein
MATVRGVELTKSLLRNRLHEPRTPDLAPDQPHVKERRQLDKGTPHGDRSRYLSWEIEFDRQSVRTCLPSDDWVLPPVAWHNDFAKSYPLSDGSDWSVIASTNSNKESRERSCWSVGAGAIHPFWLRLTDSYFRGTLLAVRLLSDEIDGCYIKKS